MIVNLYLDVKREEREMMINPLEHQWATTWREGEKVTHLGMEREEVEEEEVGEREREVEVIVEREEEEEVEEEERERVEAEAEADHVTIVAVVVAAATVLALTLSLALQLDVIDLIEREGEDMQTLDRDLPRLVLLLLSLNLYLTKH